jgi:hypothetical protein
LQPLNVVEQEFEGTAMMVAVPQTGTLPQDPHVPMPSPLRAILYAVIATVLAASLYVCIEAAVMIYDFYQIIQWLGALAEHS